VRFEVEVFFMRIRMQRDVLSTCGSQASEPLLTKIKRFTGSGEERGYAQPAQELKLEYHRAMANA
jgi:hypothetical protein